MMLTGPVFLSQGVVPGVPAETNTTKRKGSTMTTATAETAKTADERLDDVLPMLVIGAFTIKGDTTGGRELLAAWDRKRSALLAEHPEHADHYAKVDRIIRGLERGPGIPRLV